MTSPPKKRLARRRGTELPNLDPDLVEYQILKEKIAELQEQMKSQQATLIEQIEEHYDGVYEGIRHSARVVRTKRNDLDVVSLRDKLTAPQLAACSATVIDTAKLSAAVANGEIPAALVADHTTVKESSPYIRIT